MKIIQIIPSLNLAGAETMCTNLSLELNKLGHSTRVISLFSNRTSLSRKLEDEGVKIYYLDKKKGIDLSIYFKIHKILKHEKPDVIHTHLGVDKYIFFKPHKCKYVHTVHNIANKEVSKFEIPFYKVLYKLKLITPVALSEIVQKSINEVYKLNTNNVPIVFNGVDLSKCQVKQEYDIKNVPTLICVARLSYQKNHLTLIDSFDKALKRFGEMKLILVGIGELKNVILERLNTLNLNENVIMFGQSDNVFSLLKKADAFILTSIYEGIPISIIEAMGTALPIIATNVGGVLDMIEDKKNGILCENNVESICDAILEMITDKNKRTAYGQAALETAYEKFSSKTMARKYIDIYTNDIKIY